MIDKLKVKKFQSSIHDYQHESNKKNKINSFIFKIQPISKFLVKRKWIRRYWIKLEKKGINKWRI